MKINTNESFILMLLSSLAEVAVEAVAAYFRVPDGVARADTGDVHH